MIELMADWTWVDWFWRLVIVVFVVGFLALILSDVKNNLTAAARAEGAREADEARDRKDIAAGLAKWDLDPKTGKVVLVRWDPRSPPCLECWPCGRSHEALGLS